MAKEEHGIIRKGSLADNWLKGFNQFISELSMGDTSAEAEKKRRLERLGMHPEAQLEEQKRQDEASATPGQDPDKPKEFSDYASTDPTQIMRRDAERPVSRKMPPDVVRGPTSDMTEGDTESPSTNPMSKAEQGRLGDLIAGQKVDNSGASGNTSGQESGSEKSALEQQVATLTAQVEKLTQAGQSTGNQFLQSATPTGAGTTMPEGLHTTRVGSSGTNIYSGEQGIPDEAPAQQAPPPENPRIPRAGMRRGISQAVQAGNRQDAASGGGNRGLMAAIGDAVGGAANAISGGPRAPLKAQYKNMGQTELARLQRQGIEIYETETDPFALSFRGR